MYRKILRFTFGSALILAIVLMLAFNALLLWVATGPRSLDRLSPYIESSLAPMGSDYSVRIGQTWLIWDGWKHPIDIRLRDISFVMPDGTIFSTFPEISLGIDVLTLPLGRILPTSVTINHPVISLLQNEDRSVSFGMSGESTEEAKPQTQAAVPFAAALEGLLATDGSSTLKKLRFINIKNADITVGSAAKGVFFEASGTDIILSRDKTGFVRVHTQSTLHYGEYESAISAEFSVQPGETTINGKAEFSKLMLAKLSDLFYQDDIVKMISLPVSGEATISMERSGQVLAASVAMETGEGTIKTEEIAEPLNVKSLRVVGSWDHSGEISLQRLEGEIDGISLVAVGSGTYKEGQSSATGDIKLQHATVKQVGQLWPKSLAPETREWVVTSITDGKIHHADVHLAISPGDFDKPYLPKQAIGVTIALEDATLKYLPEHPAGTNIKSLVHIDGVSLDAKILVGSYLKESKVTGGDLLIEDLNADNPYIKLNLQVESTAKDMVHFLGLPRLKHAERLGLTEQGATGTVKGTAALGFHFYEPKGNADDLTYDVQGEVAGVSQSGFLNKFDIADATGTIAVNNKSVKFNGSGNVNGASVSEGEVEYLYTPKGGFDTFVDVKASAPVESLPKFNYPAFPFLKGTLGVNAKAKIGDIQEVADVTLGLTNATVTGNISGWEKADKEPATLVMSTDTQNGITKITKFNLKGKETEVNGMMEIDNQAGAIRLIDVDKASYGRTELSRFYYEIIPGGYKIEAEGASADITNYMDQNGDFSFEKFPATQFKADVGKVILGNSGSLSKVKGDVTCDTKQCSSANVTAETDGENPKPLSLRILRDSTGKRQLAIRSDDAGAFFQIFDIMKGVQGGVMTIAGDYVDQKDGSSMLKATLNVTDYVVKDAPVLGKILSLASLTGFFDTLRGDGIRFAKLKAPFTLYKDVLTIEDARTHGPAMGITAEGTITFPDVKLDIKGNVVPAYSLNSVVGKVPVVGKVLTGGDGGGVFAVRYSVSGTEKDPNVGVNPLSMLTPGFLRGLFDVFDSDSKPSTNKDEKPKAAYPTK